MVGDGGGLPAAEGLELVTLIVSCPIPTFYPWAAIAATRLHRAGTVLIHAVPQIGIGSRHPQPRRRISSRILAEPVEAHAVR